MLVHFPIALGFAVLLCDGMLWRWGDGFWLLRPARVIGAGLALSALGAVMIGVAGWHGGKLVCYGLAVLPQEDSATED